MKIRAPGFAGRSPQNQRRWCGIFVEQEAATDLPRPLLFQFWVELVNLHGDDEGIGERFHAVEPDVLRAEDGAFKIAEVVELGEFPEFILVVEVRHEDVFRVGKNVRMDGGNLLRGIDSRDARLGAFLHDARPRLGERLVAADEIVGFLDVDDDVRRMLAQAEDRHRAFEDVLGDAFAQAVALGGVADGEVEDDNFSVHEMLEDFLADVRGAVGRMIFLERLQQPVAGDVGALIIFLKQQVDERLGVGIKPRIVAAGVELLPDLVRQIKPVKVCKAVKPSLGSTVGFTSLRTLALASNLNLKPLGSSNPARARTA